MHGADVALANVGMEIIQEGGDDFVGAGQDEKTIGAVPGQLKEVFRHALEMPMHVLVNMSLVARLRPAALLMLTRNSLVARLVDLFDLIEVAVEDARLVAGDQAGTVGLRTLEDPDQRCYVGGETDRHGRTDLIGHGLDVPNTGLAAGEDRDAVAVAGCLVTNVDANTVKVALQRLGLLVREAFVDLLFGLT